MSQEKLLDQMSIVMGSHGTMGRYPQCQQGTLRHIAAITDRPVIRRILRHRPPLTANCHQAPVPPVGTTSRGRQAGTHERPIGGHLRHVAVRLRLIDGLA